MYDEQNVFDENNEVKVRRLPARGLSCLMLVVLLFGVIGTPAVILYRWYSSRPQPLVTPAGEDDGLVNRIAYITEDHQLATVAPDGSNDQRLTGLSELFQFPAWSPDGTHLAVIGGNSVYVVPDMRGAEAAGELHSVYSSAEAAPIYLYWSPDSQQVSFITGHSEGLALHLADKNEVDAPSRLLATGQPFYWDWSPGGEEMMIHTGVSGDDGRLAMIDPYGDGADEDIGQPGMFQAPGISNSGQFLAYAKVDEQDESQLVIQDSEGNLRFVEPHLGQVAMNWSPVDDLLAYTSPTLDSPAFYGPLRLVDAETGESRALSRELIFAFFWAPDGRSIAYLTLPERSSGGVQAAVPEKGRLMVKVQHPRLQMDLWIVDVESGYPHRLFTFEPTNTFTTRFLPYFDQFALSHRIWSPLSDALVLPIADGDTPRIVVVPVDGRIPRPVAEGSIAFWSQQ